MAIQSAHKTVCAIAEVGVSSPVYHILGHLTLSRLSLENTVLRANHLGDGAFAERMVAGHHVVSLTLEGLSDGSIAEGILMQSMLEHKPCLLRFDDAQGNRYDGMFVASRLLREAAGGRQERLVVDLASSGDVAIS